MFEAQEKCPCCAGTSLIRTEVYAEYGYQIGECVNCRYDRGGELPDELQPEVAETGEVLDESPVGASGDGLPEGVTALAGGWYLLPDGGKVRGKAKLKELYPDWGGEE